MKKRFLAALATGLLVVGMGGMAQAAAFTIETTLTGDPRLGNPDNLIVDVTITGDDASGVTSWEIDINSPLHTDIKLKELYFNLLVDPTSVTFGGFNPTGWAVEYPANNATASGSADFIFKALDPAGQPNAADVTNTTSLLFTATLSSGFWNTNMFYNAPYSYSSDPAFSPFQMGAHLQSLTVPYGSNMSDSGYAVGNYNPVPEPATMLLFGTGLAGLAGIARRRKKN